MSWQALAERLARERCAAILKRVEAAVAAHAPDATIERDGEAVRARGRDLTARWLSELGLRFARRLRP
jgi:hypothetical protein